MSSMMPKTSPPIELFYCYSHEDHSLCNELDTHLAGLRRTGLITTWYDRDIPAGANWKQEIEKHLNSAQVILLLVSPDFMQSDYCYNKELQLAIQRQRTNGALVIPILLRPVDWTDTTFSDLQMLPTNAIPVTSWSNRDEAFKEIVKEIRRVVNNLLTGQERLSSKARLSVYISRRNIIVVGLMTVGGSLVLGGWEMVRSINAHPWINKYTKHMNSVWTVAWSPDGHFVASAEAGKDINNEATIRIWEALTSKDKQIYRDLHDVVQQITWSTNGMYIAYASRDGVAYVRNVLESGSMPETYGKPIYNDYVICISWSPNGARIATGHFDHKVRIWDATKDHQLLYVYHHHTSAVRCLAWSPTSEYIVSSCDDPNNHKVEIWNASTGEIYSTYTGHIDSVQSVAWSLDGKLIASACTDSTVHVWNPLSPAGQQVSVYPGHSETVTGVSWDSTSRRIVSVSWDKQAHVWDAADGSHVYIYRGHTDKIRCVSWATKTNYIATAGDDSTVQIWQDERP